jgi:hypothetical protein
MEHETLRLIGELFYMNLCGVVLTISLLKLLSDGKLLVYTKLLGRESHFAQR